MQVKVNDRQLEFSFSDSESMFDMAYQVLEQENIDEMLPYKRKQAVKKENIIFNIKGNNIINLDEKLPQMTNKELADVLYELFYIMVKLERNGLLKRQCIWIKDNCVYYDTKHDIIRVAILPLTAEFGLDECEKWYDDLHRIIGKVSGFMSKDSQKRVMAIADDVKSNIKTPQDVLDDIDDIGCNVSTALYDKLDIKRRKHLRLLYSGVEGKFALDMEKNMDEYVIGRNDIKVSELVSRRHCRIVRMNYSFFVQDLDSANATLVNGVMVPPYGLMEISNKDVLTIADLEFRVRITD